MSELRRDPIIGRWIVAYTEREKQSLDLILEKRPKVETKESAPCPVCAGNEDQTLPEIFAIRAPDTAPNTSGWSVRVVPHRFAVLKIEGELNRRGKGVYDLINGIGAHEMILETSQHFTNMAYLSAEQIQKVLQVYKERIIDLSQDKRFRYVLIFKNQGRETLPVLEHTHSLLIAMPVTPKSIKEELVGAKEYFEYKERCIYCDIIKQEIEAGERIICEDENFLAFCPFASRFPFEIWIIPKTHQADYTHIDHKGLKNLAKILQSILTKMNKALAEPPFNYVLHTIPFLAPKAGYWKTIHKDYHWHIEIMPQVLRVAGFEWGSGFYINPISPETASKMLSEV